MNEDIKLLLGGDEERRPTDPLSSLIGPLLRSFHLILFFGLIGAVLGVAKGVLTPNKFLSTGKLLVNSGARESATPESTITEGGSANPYNRDAVNNEVHLLNDPEVFKRTVLSVGPEKILEVYNPYDPASSKGVRGKIHKLQAWWFSGLAGGESVHPIDDCDSCVRVAMKALMQGITIEAEPYSSIIGISYGAHTPVLAQEIVATFLEASDEHHRDTFAFDTSVAFLNDQVDEALANSMESDQELTAFRISCSVYDITEQRDNLITVRHSLEQGLVSDENRLTELDTLLTFLQSELELTPPMIEVTNSGGLRPEVAIGTSEMRENPRWTRLQRNLDETNIERTSLLASATRKRERFETLQDELVNLEQCEPQHRLLEIDSNRKRDRATRFLEAYERAELLNLLDQVEMSNLRVLQHASFPLEKSGPVRTKLAIMGLVFGLAMGLGLSFALGMFDKRMRNPALVAYELGIPVLATVQDSRAMRIKVPKNRKAKRSTKPIAEHRPLEKRKAG